MTKQETKSNKDVSYKGSWGYAVCFGSVIAFIAGIGHVNSLGFIYNDFMIDTHSTAQSLTTAHGVFSIMLAIGGIILNNIITKLPLRLGGIIGAAIFCIGSFMTLLISNTNQLPLTFGILQGIGFGMIVPVCYSTLNHYYVRRRTTVMSICKAVQGIILIWYPLLLRTVMSMYGFRGTLLIISGISLHTLPGMLIMKTDSKKHSIKITAANNVEKGKTEHENVDLLMIKENMTKKVIPMHQKQNKLRNRLLNIVNINSLRDPVFCNICIGQCFVNFSDLTFFILQPMLLLQYGYDKTQVVICISICAGADVAGRCILAVISSIIPINTRLLFYVATLFTLLIRIVILQIRQFVWVATVIGALGVLRAWLHIASPLIISNHVSHENFPGAYAFFMLSTGIVNVTFSPLIGLLKDIYQDYIPAFYALTVCCTPCLLFWPIEYTLRKKTLFRGSLY